ncbi:unnamed protein product [Ostreobium quekettii]|uniref:U-box domain-containing protein n=1 Tax=Ostreobium quekettii TaxID=121088 RepID=A0A8S1J5Z0_9CHLO|nr:unnamed protein product [Ostreobium quekettii]|eukprot:evm.model.scf_2568EXC.1 EVM.evm.TU.scf_2568EXC.1   scf_2568EXC:17069-19698(+)
MGCFRRPPIGQGRARSGWATAALVFGSVSVALNSLSGGGQGGDGRGPAGAALWYLGLALNVALVAAGGYFFVSRGVAWWERRKAADDFIERTWQIVNQGPGTAGLAGKDLGEADEDGVYTRQTRSGGALYLRPSKDAAGMQSWEWSLDRVMWMSASKADHFWNGKYGISPAAHKLIVRRLQVESALRARQPVQPTCTHPPPIELELSWKEKSRLIKEVPKEFLCPMSMEVMTEPVVAPSGVTYDRPAVEEWINEHHSDPASKSPLLNDHLYPNLALRDMIQQWLAEHKYVRT